jgi:hypothetical protein
MGRRRDCAGKFGCVVSLSHDSLALHEQRNRSLALAWLMRKVYCQSKPVPEAFFILV